jgi:hypothetical protein
MTPDRLAERAEQSLLLERCRSDEWKARAERAEGKLARVRDLTIGATYIDEDDDRFLWLLVDDVIKAIEEE